MQKILLSEIWTYPIKSLGGFKQETTECMHYGLKYDRKWMLIDGTNTFLTQREISDLAFFRTSLTNEGIHVSHPSDSSITIPFESKSKDFFEARVWEDTCIVQAVSDEIDTWFTDILGFPCRLVFVPDMYLRNVDADYNPWGKKTSLTDGFPILIISEASLADLNDRLEIPVPMNRFRPNLVVTGAEAYAEDQWLSVRIATLRIELVKLCGRCIVTTIDQDTAMKAKEPLKTLSKYRIKNSKVMFGKNAIPLDTGLLRVGDEIEILN
jgi:uncharacterized protein